MSLAAIPYPAAIPPKGVIRVLFSCVGRRVELMTAFRAAAEALRRPLVAHATDRSWLAPAMHLVDRAHRSPPIDDPDYVPHLLRIVRREGIHLVVPLIDSDLMMLSLARPRFAELGCTVLISSPRVVAICRDKLLSYRHLTEAGIQTPRTWSLDELLAGRRAGFPLYIKPRAGSAARGHYVCDDRSELQVLARRVTDPIFQEFVGGNEYTMDAYAAFDGRPRCVVPRQRLEIRTGEVSKGRVVMDPQLIDIGRRVVESLAECVGVITIQVIRGPDRRVRVIEINPRVGGGIPLSIAAGADFPRWILSTLAGKPPTIRPSGFRNGLHMLRYDSSVICPAEKLRNPGAPPARVAGARRRRS